MLIKGCMSALLEEDDRLSNLGLLLSKYEETVREKELDNQQLLSKVAELEAKNKALEADLDDRKREVNLRCAQIQERDTQIAELTAKLDKAREALHNISNNWSEADAIAAKAIRELDK
jgi:predicted RNase H-like nuclease (RuvC/YqgF family)